MRNKEQLGLTIMETAAALVIVAMAAAAIAMFAGNVMNDVNVKKTSNIVHEIQKSITKIYNNKRNYSGLNVEVMANSGMLPDSMINSARSRIQSPLGRMDVWGVSFPECGGSFCGFTIAIVGPRSDECIKLVGSSYGAMHFRTRVIPASGSGSYVEIKDVATAVSQCSIESRTTIRFDFKG